MRQQLVAYMAADPGVVALAADRVSWGYRQQGQAGPALTFDKTDGADDVAIGGVTGFVEGYVQADCWAATALDATGLALAVRLAAHAANVGNTGGVIQGVFVMHEADESEGEGPDRIFRTRLALRVPYTEA